MVKPAAQVCAKGERLSLKAASKAGLGEFCCGPHESFLEKLSPRSPVTVLALSPGDQSTRTGSVCWES